MVASAVASGIEALGTNFKLGKINGRYTPNNFGKRDIFKSSLIASGGVSGGFSSWIAGGKFIDGFKQGLITSGLNHVLHRVEWNDKCPPCSDNKENISLVEAYENAMEGGEKLYQDITKLGIELKESDFNNKGVAVLNMASPANILKYGDKALVHGNITFVRMQGNHEYAQVAWNNKLNCRCGYYDFEIHGTRPSFRNWATGLGGVLHTRNLLAIFTGEPIYGPLKFLIQYTNVIKISR